MAHSKYYIKLMNSREWKALRIRKLQANPLCERCLAEFGRSVAARVVHHIKPIEATNNHDEMRQRAFDYDNLQSLCFECHRAIHVADHYHASDAMKERQKQRLDQWKDQLAKRFGG
jgi:5-methylcytosine-specific restriction protein A